MNGATDEMYRQGCRQLRILGWVHQWQDKNRHFETHLEISDAIGPEVGAEWMCDAVDLVAEVLAMLGLSAETMAGKIFNRHVVVGCEECERCAYFQGTFVHYPVKG